MNRTVYFEDLEVSRPLPPLTKPAIDRTQLVKYAGASGDFNPLHYLDEVGQMAGTGGVIAHGMLVMGFVGQAVTQWIPNRNLTSLAVRFVDITKPGDSITVTGVITEKRLEKGVGLVQGQVVAADQRGGVKVKGTFEAVLPLKNSL
ncbi:MaoC/PaaZ C-terminal domain-containing protein [Desulfallas thermosapovorans]|uniref:Acyl dehydratase n=1 Tax=Desulfallas thermosapovorans DSM 6562 TaxID=1121431 RepID=A0A5S4ZMZ2_9FIRM|nr:MaoC/PaaZ C-terminal domain-containing protein [Desulfallas thermosapovorans]TYO93306.1 acyl dehydratase [Desulfallas thermosapovorans DSM 6562]